MCILDCILQEKDCICFHSLPWLTWLEDTLNVITVMSLNPTRECWICSILWSEITCLTLWLHKGRLPILKGNGPRHSWEYHLKSMCHWRIGKGIGGVEGEGIFRGIIQRIASSTLKMIKIGRVYGHDLTSMIKKLRRHCRRIYVTHLCAMFGPGSDPYLFLLVLINHCTKSWARLESRYLL